MRPSNVLREFLNPVVNSFTWKTLPSVNRKYFFMNILWIESSYSQKRDRLLLFGSILLKHGRHFDYWNQPLNMRMRVCYQDGHEAGLCCYLVIHTENLLHQLQLFYLHLWLIYWLCLVLLSLSTKKIIYRFPAHRLFVCSFEILHDVTSQKMATTLIS
jgi:hypothetical protein